VSHEESVFTLLVESNPIPDIDDLPLADVSGSAYLATLQQRNSGMTQLETKKTQQGDRRWRNRGLMVAFAGVAVIVLVLALVVFQGDSQQVVDDPEPVPTTTPLPTPPQPDPAELEGFTGNEPAGTYRPALFQPVFAFTLAREGWRPEYGMGRHFGLIPPETWDQYQSDGDGIGVVIFFTAPNASTRSGAETVDDVVSYITNHPGLGQVTQESTTLAGSDAQLITAVGTTSTAPLWDNGQNIWFGTGQDHEYTFYVLEVAGAPVAVTVNYQDAGQRSSLAEEVDAILESIRWAATD
jgi:hypothetical protein